LALPPTATGSFGLTPRYLTVLGGQVLFEGTDSSGDLGLWTTDGTPLGTMELTSIVGASTAGLAPSDLTVFGSDDLFSGIDSNGQTGLWATNGTAAGTHELTGIGGTASAGIAPTDLTVFGSEVLFNGTDSAGNLGLWVTNGTAAGTQELTAVAAASATGIDPGGMAVVNNKVLFNGLDANGLSGLWVTDGTAGGTHELVAGGGTSDPFGLNPTNITAYNGEILFNGLDASGNMGLWVSDGTATGTHELTGIAGADPSGLAPSDLTVLNNNEILFRGFDQLGRPQLWVTNGTAAGTHELTGIVGAGTTGNGFDPSGFTVYDGMVLFSGADTNGHDELWTTDGTAAGTTEIDPSSPGRSIGLSPLDLTALTPGALVLSTIAGTVSGQTTTSEAPVRPFAHVTIGDANVGATDTLTITVGGVGGTLSDGTGFTSLTTVSAGVYRLSGPAGEITSELDALIFAATAGAPKTTSTTTFTLSDQSNANGVPVADTFTTVIDTDPPPPPPPITNSILWQNANGQASIWNMNESALVGGGAVTPNPGRIWRAVGTGDFNDDGHSDILWQNTSTGQASI
jgi:ELWxxDGT repeat protein